jgi:hypothetical protein
MDAEHEYVCVFVVVDLLDYNLVLKLGAIVTENLLISMFE